jgi:hypothetical protein
MADDETGTTKKVTRKKTIPQAPVAKKVTTRKKVVAKAAADDPFIEVREALAVSAASPVPAPEVVSPAAALPVDPRAAEAPAPAADEPSAVTPESAAPTPAEPPPTKVSPEKRQRMVEEAAYYRALRRGFAPGNEAEDWAAAEEEIERLLAGQGQA